MTVATATVPTMDTKITERRTTRPAVRRMGTYLPLLALLGVALPILIYLTVMQTLGWQVPRLGMNGLLPTYEYGATNTVLYASRTTRDYFARAGGNYETLLVPWRSYFSARRAGFKELSTADQLNAQKDGVVILPSAVALDLDERTALAAFRARGGAILATWASGARNGKGDWEGWQFLESLGAQMIGEMPATAEAGHLIMNGESPVSHQLPAGFRYAMAKTAEPLLRIKGERIAARFMNWTRISEPERRDEGAIVIAEPGPGVGRAAVFAFSESVWEARPALLYALIDDTLQWLQRDPAFLRAAWPHGKRAAQVIEMDTEEGFPNALVFAQMMKDINYRATFYVLTSVARRYPDVLSALHRDFEIGYHADVHDSFKGQSPTLQQQRMQNMRADMATILPDVATITGFRAPTEGYDGTTELLLQKNGIRHHAADPARSESRLPLIEKSKDIALQDALVVLPRTQRDDINLAQYNVEQMAQEMVADFDLTVDNGALGLLSVHTQNYQAEGVLARAMVKLLDRIKQRRDHVWLAPAGDVATWWKERERFRLSVTKSGKRLDMNVSIAGTTPLQGATVLVMLPQKGVLPQVHSAKIGLPKPEVLLLDDYRAAIVFEKLAPGDYAYQASFASGK
ncbi:polysaccharide deacetylase family protein [Noviherbaspirillum malthae]|uniref:polysaccharide deacetylase family protein n=1 Tax=Noviherbaspirillum malthae TaxID=1260987 RepID=UPI00188FBEE5|nr:polysaccharide deacetylase family protein [Noviherbaspirillum malthae]